VAKLEKVAGPAIRTASVVAVAVLLTLLIFEVHSKFSVISPNRAGNASDTVSSSRGDAPADNARRNSAGEVQRVQTPMRTGRAASTATSTVSRKVASPARQTATPVSTPVAPPVSSLDLAVQHPFKDATLFVWVDDRLVLTRALHGGTQKRFIVFKEIRGVESETLKIPPGQHFLRLRVMSADQAIDLSKTVLADFAEGDGKSLQVIVDKHNTIRLTWQ
jgi:hypothetical protein